MPESDLERLRNELESFDDLPSPPRVLDEIMRVLGSDESSAGSLSGTVEKDTALTAKLLRLANSAYFGLAHSIGEVRGACVVLGFEMVRAMALGVSTLDALSGRAGKAIDLESFWRHSVGTGTAARQLVEGLSMPGAGTAFCAGVLHDAGKLVLATLSGQRYAKVVEGDPRVPFRVREAREFGGDHETVGEWIAARWHLPPELGEAIRAHHEPWNDTEPNRWGALVHVADWVARRHGCPSAPAGDDAAGTAPDRRATEILGMPQAVLTAVCDRFAAELDTVESFVDQARS